MNIVYERISDADVEELAPIMKRAFDEDSIRHLGEIGGPPGYDNGDFIRKWYLTSGADAYKILLDDRIIGGFCVFANRGARFLGNIFLDTDCQDKGIGSQVWRDIEKRYPDTKKWRTETPGFSKRNHNFYVNKCGFKVVKIEHPKDDRESSYCFEKEMKGSKK